MVEFIGTTGGQTSSGRPDTVYQTFNILHFAV